MAGGSANRALAGQSTVGGGILNTNQASEGSIGGGAKNTVLASSVRGTIPGGSHAVARSYGQMAYASGAFLNPGAAQASTYVLRGTTSDASPTELLLDAGDSGSQRMKMPLKGTWFFEISIIAKRTVSTGYVASYQIKGMASRNVFGDVSLIGTPVKSEFDGSWTDWDASVEPNTSNGALSVKVTGSAGFDIKWVASVRTVEIID